MKGTAVELLYKFLYESKDINGFDSGSFNQEEVFKYFIGLEKKQMKKAYNHDRPNLLCYEKGTAFKEYYSKNYKVEEL
jgi:hypothetical protein